LENQIAVNYSTIILTACNIMVGIFGFFVVRLVKGFDGQVKELYRRTDEYSTKIAKLENDIQWIKCEIGKGDR
jgi:hypothetical protein